MTRIVACVSWFVIAFAGCQAAMEVATQQPDLRMKQVDCVETPGACGGCRADTDCSDPALPRCDRYSSSCVACLPDGNDCPAGRTCSGAAGTWRCVETCTANADCQHIGGGTTCCGGACVGLGTDVHNCGGCGVDCGTVNNGAPACVEGHCVVGSCLAGFADCDLEPVNGCETATAADAANCGGCGKACKPFANGLPTCTAGACSAVCAPGWSSCDGEVANGCEIDISGNPAHCGGCGKSCSTPANAVAACDLGTCAFRCQLGFSDCDQDPKNGCEVSASKDPLHCGHCGNVCPIRPNAVAATCVAGQCKNDCQQGFADCDNKPANGCESDSATDLNNCGGCGKLCSNRNAVATCAMGVCTLQCNAAYVDCNNDTKDGCEANLKTDPMNCGGCGNVCPMNLPGCQNGQCVQGYFPVGPQVNVPVNQLAGWQQCYIGTYAQAGVSLAQLLAMCSGSKLLLACRPTNNPTLTLMAWADRPDVLFDVGNVSNAFHDANGTSWYYAGTYSWGFFWPGDGVSRSSCDTATGAKREMRLCWHTSANNMNGGYRCGATTSLNASAAWERIVYQIQ